MLTELRVQETGFPGCLVIEPPVFSDRRGCFVEIHHSQKLKAAGLDVTFVQDNYSQSAQGTLRGLHYQISQTQGKLVWVVRGAIRDVVVDLRKSSPMFGKSFSVELSEDNFRQIYVPPGFAHGFFVQSEKADVFYKCTDFYAPKHERTLLWNDPALDITWPSTNPILSDKDRCGTPFAEAETFG
jgi:dTDP-4-dehydrorhamnose 3,5-epimerase